MRSDLNRGLEAKQAGVGVVIYRFHFAESEAAASLVRY
jgi:hypothetical protein